MQPATTESANAISLLKTLGIHLVEIGDRHAVMQVEIDDRQHVPAERTDPHDMLRRMRHRRYLARPHDLTHEIDGNDVFLFAEQERQHLKKLLLLRL